MNAGRIKDSDDFRHLARKLSHACLEKERRHSALVVSGNELMMNSEIRKKIEKLVDGFFEKLQGVYHQTS